MNFQTDWLTHLLSSLAQRRISFLYYANHLENTALLEF